MHDLRLDYFDFDGGRGEAARIALSIGKIHFDDHRIPLAEWKAARNDEPLLAVPVLHVDGVPVTQSNSINRFVGRLTGMYPEDPLLALRCDEVMDAVEDVVVKVVPTFFMEDEAEKKAAREKLVDGEVKLYLEYFQALLERSSGDYFVDDQFTVADLKVFLWSRNLSSGTLDYVPTDIIEKNAPKVAEHRDKIAVQPGVKAYYDGR
jgi:glutathione S-transferase